MAQCPLIPGRSGNKKVVDKTVSQIPMSIKNLFCDPKKLLRSFCANWDAGREGEHISLGLIYKNLSGSKKKGGSA